MRALWLSVAPIVLLASVLGAGCAEHAGTTTTAVAVAPLPVVSERQRAETALAAFLASRSIREMPAHRDASVDLDGDGIDDLLMLLDDQNWCDAGGCTLLVFRGGADGYRLVSDSVSTRAPIAVADRMNRGWHDLMVTVGSEGESGVVALEFDGTRYPSDPTMGALLDPSRLISAKPLIAATGTAVASQ
ncbi:hypothetical protein MNR01_09770 [Lysobacter sp. S4-A87]|uniref:hypothetical protein n=1 Tax=Lysobacter sp. S4-A87 TaxID=2925843 RepID=UPI001F535FBD|nr:hypothetical protein [Lysobacter sp. S4-A87]UNK48076.1 hypothetical protein MNR01_09770 [Lysobacter sp. S4-A87]